MARTKRGEAPQDATVYDAFGGEHTVTTERAKNLKARGTHTDRPPRPKPVNAGQDRSSSLLRPVRKGQTGQSQVKKDKPVDETEVEETEGTE